MLLEHFETPSMRAVWSTDIHLDFLSPHARQDFLAVVASKHPDVVFLTGDVSIAPYLIEHLSEFSSAINKPVLATASSKLTGFGNRKPGST
jgi:hypothetical protein